MDLLCPSCKTKLTLPDDKVPKDAVFKVSCYKCSKVIQVSTRSNPNGPPPPTGAAESAAASKPASEIVTPPDSPEAASTGSGSGSSSKSSSQTSNQEAEAKADTSQPVDKFSSSQTSPEDDEIGFLDNQQLAMVCFKQPNQMEFAVSVLKGLDYTVHVPTSPEDALERIRQHRYEVIVVHEDYQPINTAATLSVLRTLQTMPMAQRRPICVGFVGKRLRTFDNMIALAASVNFVIGERDFPKLNAILRRGIAEHEQLFRVFNDVLKEIGRT